MIEMILTYYLNAFIPFYVQLGIAETLFVIGLKRKPMFVVRLITGIVISAAALFLLSVINAALPLWYVGALIYVAMFAISIGILVVCFDESPGTILFCSVAGYAAQNMAYRLFSVLETSTLLFRLMAYMDRQIVYNLFSALCVAAVYVFTWFMFARRIKNHSLARIHNRNVLVISAITIIVVIVLCSWTNNYYWHHLPLVMINSLFSILCCAFILCLQSDMVVNVGLKADIEIIEKMWRDDKRRYEIAKENIDIINVKYHDLKHRLLELKAGKCEVSDEEIREIEDAIGIYDTSVETGCDPLDVILSEKSLYCRRNGITLTCMVDGGSLTFMSASELYSLFGNILSNAVEAVSDLSDGDKKVISFTVRRVGDMLIVESENYYSGNISFKDGLPLTSKGDKQSHGYGMKSIKMLAEKYGGEMSVYTDEDVYRLTILLPLPPPEENTATMKEAS